MCLSPSLLGLLHSLWAYVPSMRLMAGLNLCGCRENDFHVSCLLLHAEVFRDEKSLRKTYLDRLPKDHVLAMETYINSDCKHAIKL